MASRETGAASAHSHDFLGADHERSERKTWAVIWLCGAMMVGEIVGGLMFGSIALVADGMHMSTHAGAMLLAAFAYSYARKHVADPRFTFGTGKLGDLAGFASAIILAMIALLIGYEAVSRLSRRCRSISPRRSRSPVSGLAVNRRQRLVVRRRAIIMSRRMVMAIRHGHGHGATQHDHDGVIGTIRSKAL